METPMKFVISILLIWLVLGGLLSLFDMDNYVEGTSINPNTEKTDFSIFTLSGIGQMLTHIWDFMTFNVVGMPQSFRVGLSSFLSVSMLLSIYVLIRSGS